MSTPKTCVALLSGGLDSATAVAIMRSRGYRVCALSFRYGQRHQAELEAAQQVARAGGIDEHRIVDLDLAQFGGSALTSELAVPKRDSADELTSAAPSSASDEAAHNREEESLAHGSGGGGPLNGQSIPVTYVPARNTVFLSIALAWAEVLEATELVIGVNALDYSGYPDCRPEFIRAFETLANLATKTAVEGRRFTIHAPLMDLTKAEIIAKGLELGVDYGQTISCYDPVDVSTSDGTGECLSCGRCDACVLRLRGFAACGRKDPIRYVPAEPDERQS